MRGVRIAIFIAGLVIFLIWLVFTYLAAEPNVRLGVVSASLALLGSVTSVAISDYYSRQKELELRLAEKKVPAYESVFSLFLNMFGASKGFSKPKNGQALAKELSKISKEVMIWGGPGVVKRWSEFRTQSEALSQSDQVAMVRASGRTMISLFRDMRRDLGHDDMDVSDEEYASTIFSKEVVNVIYARQKPGSRG